MWPQAKNYSISTNGLYALSETIMNGQLNFLFHNGVIQQYVLIQSQSILLGNNYEYENVSVSKIFKSKLWEFG